jgi:signal transduction histidine kinase
VHPEDRAYVNQSWTDAIAGKGEYSVEFRVQWPDGSIHWLSSKGRLLRNNQGEPEHFVGVVMDITLQKEMEQSLRKAISLRDEFLSIASHELRTPITGMKLQTQMMKRGIERGDLNVFSQPRVNQLVQRIDHGLDRLARLIEDMLDISKIQLGKLSIHHQEFDLVTTIRDTIDRFRSQLLAAGILTSVVAGTECRIIGDRFRFEQVVTNFITNTVRYAPGGPLRVTVCHDENDAWVEFEDSGPGIAKENQERIFERFERLVSADEVSGMGLGLYIVKQIIEAHQGSIRVESELGKGAKFIIRIPLCPSLETES